MGKPSKKENNSTLTEDLYLSNKDDEIRKLMRMAAYIKSETEALGLTLPTYFADMLVHSLSETDD